MSTNEILRTHAGARPWQGERDGTDTAGPAFFRRRKTVVVVDSPRRFAEPAVGIVAAARAGVRTVTLRSRPKRRYYHPHRESFIENAAMSREMFTL
jgi:hypothetical protein